MNGAQAATGVDWVIIMHRFLTEQSFGFRVSSSFNLRSYNMSWPSTNLRYKKKVILFEPKKPETRNPKLVLIQLTFLFVKFSCFFRISFCNINITHIRK